jgi:SET domain-containing protein
MHREHSYVANSPIHGRGLFAKKKIRKGVHIGIYEGKKVKRDGTHVLWVEDEKKGWFGINGVNELRYLNHSKRPNAEFEGEELYAIRPIATGAEITFDYGEDWDDIV